MSSPLIFLITGASSGLGLSLANAILAARHKVIATIRNHSGAHPSLTSSPDCAILPLDVTSPALESQLSTCLSHFGHIDVLINNAGYGYGGALEDSDADLSNARLLFETLFWGPIRLTRSLTPHFRARAGGTVVNVTSTEGVAGSPGLAFYCAAKHALEGASEALAAELAPFGVRTIIAEPGSMRTRFFDPENAREVAMSEPYRGGPVEYVSQMTKSLRGREGSDPERCARVIVEAVVGGGEGWPEGREKLLRLPLGKEMLARIEMKMTSVKANMDALATVAASCDFD